MKSRMRENRTSGSVRGSRQAFHKQIILKGVSRLSTRLISMEHRPERAVLPREFYMRDANTVARALLGKLLVHQSPEGLAAGMIVETEAYVGPEDDGAHSYGGRRTARTEIQFGPGGYAYVFGIYGMHNCFNAVCAGEDQPEVVLVRALEPVEGVELMEKRRGSHSLTALCSGPGKLCAALGITKEQYGLDLCGDRLFITDYKTFSAEQVRTSARINIDYAEKCRDYPWRYFLADNPHVSKVTKRYRTE